MAAASTLGLRVQALAQNLRGSNGPADRPGILGNGIPKSAGIVATGVGTNRATSSKATSGKISKGTI
jgi:hypothetical protein